MNDAPLIIGGLVLLFVAWVYTGGPTKPISFAGPYITPITNVGQEQTGYGKGEKFTVAKHSYDPNAIANAHLNGGNSGQPSYGTSGKVGLNSSFAGRVHIDSVTTGYEGQNNSGEYVSLSAGSTASPIDITGWRLVSSSSSATIPQGERLPSGSSRGASVDILLNTNMRAVVFTGYSPRYQSYLQNKCTGYFDGLNSTGYRTGNTCPSPQAEFSSFFKGSADDYNACSNYINSLQTCTEAPSRENYQSRNANYGYTYSQYLDVPSSCTTFSHDRLTYAGCVTGHKNDPNFISDTWRVFLGSSATLWRSRGDTVRLLDREDKTVDVYSY